MKLPEVSMICAMTPNHVIGNNGTMPWRIKRDLEYFRKRTRNSAVVMGPKTFKSILEVNGGPLEKRLNIVLTTDKDFKATGVKVAHDPQQALSLAAIEEWPEFFVIGGAMVYASFLPLAEQLFITYVQAGIAGDTHFPHWDQDEWYLVNQNFDETKWSQEVGDDYPIKFAHYRRKVLEHKQPRISRRHFTPPK